MPKRAPRELTELLRARETSAVQCAWQEFLRLHSSLLIRATRTLDGDYDANMDRYAFVLEQLRADEFKRLRTYQPNGRSKFTTWLVVVAKRLCIDHHRQRYGRPQKSDRTEDSDAILTARKHLADLIGHRDFAILRDTSIPDAETQLIALEQFEALGRELAELDNRDQLLLTLRFVDGATARQIAEVMDFPSQVHVYRRLDKVLAQLRRALQEKGITASGPGAEP